MASDKRQKGGVMKAGWVQLIAIGLMITVLGTASPAVLAQSAGGEYDVRMARVQYEGGGDWYTGPEALPELIRYAQEQAGVLIDPEPDAVRLTSDQLYEYPILYLTGHGRVQFSDEEARRLRQYLENGGFLHIDDDYGLDLHIRREMQKVFPDQEFVELPFDHAIYHAHFSFPDGLPKIHEHDGEPPRGLGLFDEDGRLVVFYSHETDLGNGWDPPEVHGHDWEIREPALQMGTNILVYAMTR